MHAGRAPCSQQRELAPVALDGPQRRDVGEAEADERSGESEHDVQRLCVQRVPGGGVQLVGEVVDELDLPGERALDPVDRLQRPGVRLRRCVTELRGIGLGLDLPLHACLRAGDRR